MISSMVENPPIVTRCRRGMTDATATLEKESALAVYFGIGPSLPTLRSVVSLDAAGVRDRIGLDLSTECRLRASARVF